MTDEYQIGFHVPLTVEKMAAIIARQDAPCVCHGTLEPCVVHRLCDSNTALLSLYRAFLADANSAISVLRIESKRLRDAVNPP